MTGLPQSAQNRSGTPSVRGAAPTTGLYLRFPWGRCEVLPHTRERMYLENLLYLRETTGRQRYKKRLWEML